MSKPLPRRAPTSDPEVRVLTINEAAKELRLGRSSVYRAIERGQLPVVKIGSAVRIPRAAVEALASGSTSNAV